MLEIAGAILALCFAQRTNRLYTFAKGVNSLVTITCKMGRAALSGPKVVVVVGAEVLAKEMLAEAKVEVVVAGEMVLLIIVIQKGALRPGA